MKSLVKKLNKKRSGYPCLKTNENSGLVVLFHAQYSGVVVGADNMWSIGHYSDIWAEDIMVPFSGTITITEE